MESAPDADTSRLPTLKRDSQAETFSPSVLTTPEKGLAASSEAGGLLEEDSHLPSNSLISFPSNNPDRDALWSIKILCLLKPCECLTDTCNSPSSTGSISHARTVVLERQPIGSGCSGNVSSRSTSKSSKKSIIPPSPSTFIIFRSLSPVITGIPSTVCNSISQMPTGASDTTFRINFFFFLSFPECSPP